MNIRDATRKWGPEYLAICGLAKYFPVMNSESSVFFVNGNTGNDSDGENGQRPETPLLTITKALSLCTSGKNDYIFVLDYYQATGETWPIAITKQQVHIIGVTDEGCPWPWIQPPGNTAAINCSGNSGYSEIAGLELGAGAAHGCIEFTHSGIWGVHIHHCNFGSSTVGMTGKHGIAMPSGANTEGLIEKCKFGGGLTNDGINLDSAAAAALYGCVIRNNIFRVAGIGINVSLALNFYDGGIFDNKFVMSSDANGTGITFASGATGFVDGNVGVMEDGAAPTNNPFSDGGTGMGWGINYKGGTALLAAPA
jgi:hypothetical protein